MPEPLLPALEAAMQAEAAGDLETAVAHYATVLAAQPDCVEALNNLGSIAHRIGHYSDAIQFQRQALAARPDFLPSQVNLSRSLAKSGDLHAADAAYTAAIANAGDQQTLKIALLSEQIQLRYGHGLFAEAAALVESACAQHPESAELQLVAGNVQIYLRAPANAEHHYRRALALHDSPRGRANLALALLAQDRFEEGWPLYESRYHAELVAHDKVSFGTQACPQWQGEDLHGRRILVIGEQGMGDQIHFARFVAMLAEAGATVELQCAPALRPLLATAAGVAKIHDSTPQGTFDYWTPLLSLPMHLGKLNGRHWPGPYLHADSLRREGWRNQLTTWSNGKPKIGIAWAGSPGNAIDRMRSLSLDQVLALIAPFKGRAMFFSLQKGAEETHDLERQCIGGLIPLSDMIGDFADTAALITELDLVISVDTAVAHVTGALGRPGIVLLSPGADWRWGTLGLGECALYPSLRPVWKRPGADWQAALQQASGYLNTHLG